jgi:hypothetical protein
MKKPTHKTAHLQTAQADTQPRFAKELFSCRRTRYIDSFVQLDNVSELKFQSGLAA